MKPENILPLTTSPPQREASRTTTNHPKVMNTNDIKTEILPIDPSWEYYTIYSQLQITKTELDAILLHIGSIENPQKTDDYEIRAKLFNLIAKLRVISHNL